MADKPRLNLRFLIFAIALSGFALFALGRYAYLASLKNTIPPGSASGEQAGRGAISDRNGRQLAIQTRLANISIWRPSIEDIELLSGALSPILNIPQSEIVNRIQSSASDFLYLKKQVEQSIADKIRELQNEKGLKGVGIENIYGRVYPEKNLAGQLIGFVGDDNQGLGGIEYAYNDTLSKGEDVTLSIDVNVQYILEDIARKIMLESKPEAVMFLAMDNATGEILGSASLPNFDPNDIRNSTDTERMDRPAIWAYEPGSVFKIFSLAGLMGQGAITGESIFYCNGEYEHTTNLGERVVIKCLAAHGPVSANDIIVYSCNAGAAYASDQMDNLSFYNTLRDFGFGQRTDAGISGETPGILVDSKRWSARSKPTIAIGQEIAVSALQMMQAATIIANDGILVRPSVVLSPETAKDNRRVIDALTAQAMRSYMKNVTSDIGTGWRANVADLSLAVKTGTAQIIDSRTNRYSDTDFIASCMAMLPADEPSLVLYLVIIKPKGEFLGGRIAAPPIREAAEQLIDYLGIPRGRNPHVQHPGVVTVPNLRQIVIDEVMPDLTGYSKRELLPLINQQELKVEIKGDGWVVRQTPLPGAPVTVDTVIQLELQ
ncbi:MAG: transpeptidase family protein [Spirochaetaceae bacterium]|jgi:cell division protein FtsI (penicillin-binding protein 3)|nr:transpeptidase family protein [Spirochaetaceae bacterium]